jgi:ABC-type transport system substrate-binding protein
MMKVESKGKRGGLIMVKAKASTRRWSGLIPIVMAILLLSGTVAKTEVTSQCGGVLKIIDVAEGGQPLGAPWEVRGVDSNLIKPAVESLIREDIRGDYHPCLATDWRIDQPKNKITLSLRKGVKFHDGTNLDAEAVKWCLDQAIEAKMVKGFKGIDVLDEYTVRINVDQYQNNMLNLLSGSITSPVSPSAYKNKGKEWAMWNPVGTGPFKSVSYERGNKLTFTKWEGYWEKGKPYLDGKEFLFIRDPMTQQAAMQARGAEKVHVLAVTSGEQAAMLRAMGLKMLSMYTGTVSLIPYVRY